jgi:pimeloyl-ACP methyl ester carboxylesterase
MFPAMRPDLRVRWLTLASGLRVRTVEAGPADGPPVVLVHGWACSVYAWRGNYAALAAAGHRVISADLPGHGLSDAPLAPGSYAPDVMRRHLLDLFDALGVERAELVAGHSLGGAMSIDLALSHPERIARLALVGAVGMGPTPPAALARVLTPGIVTPLLPLFARRALYSLVLRITYGRWRGFSERDVDEYWAPTRRAAVLRAARALAHEYRWSTFTPETLARLAMPTVVLFGTRDRMVLPSAAERLVRSIPDGRLVMVEGAGHVLPEERPDVVNAELLALLARPAASRPRIAAAVDRPAAMDDDRAAATDRVAR